MAESATKKGGKKGRKVGRQKKSPAHMRYNLSSRWETNKRRRALKTANKTGHPVKIKIDGEWEIVSPR